MTFPVSQSVLDAEALAHELSTRYGLKGDVRCKLLSRGMNDIYKVEHEAGPHALKVARAGKSSEDEFAYEQDYIFHLAEQGIAVPAPVALTDESLFFSVKAPEGTRQIVMMRWLDGTPFDHTATETDAHGMGALLATLHNAVGDFDTIHRKSVNTEAKVSARLPFLTDLAKDYPKECAMVRRVSDAVLDKLSSPAVEALPRGACHGDLQCANVMAMADGSLGVFDFSDCGDDPFAKDIAAFYWRNDFEGRPETVNRSFVQGYETVRPLSEMERGAQPLYRVLRHLFITSTMAEFVNRVGPVTGFNKGLKFYFDMIRRYSRDAGIE